jgi:hypothetical protein
MITPEMRAEFERTSSRDTRRVPPKGNNYIDPMAQADWEAFQKGWHGALRLHPVREEADQSLL